jgi:hypothetical protein
MAPLNNMLKYLVGTRRAPAPTGNAGPYADGASRPGGNASNARAPLSDRWRGEPGVPVPYVSPDLSVLTNVSAAVTVSTQIAVHGESSSTKKRKERSEGGKIWKAQWSAEFPWAEPQLDSAGCVMSVKCVVCSEVKERPVNLAHKKDTLMKHCGYRLGKSRSTSRSQLGSEQVHPADTSPVPDNVHWKNDEKFMAKLVA